MLFDSYDDRLIDEDEFVLLYNLNTSKNPVFPYENYDVFELENVDEAECKAEFRVEKADLPGRSIGNSLCFSVRPTNSM